ncbi:ferrous iron transport protein A [Candidatus Sumerlaeota bacterium]|nr:ferrous iron transport protein A [Candidatus Sumerlaeota bacterium]
MKLRELVPGQRGKITGYCCRDRAYLQKLLRMGLIRGALFTLVRRAPLGDPVVLEVNGCCLTLRQNEAEILDIESA